jgi:hypothetical protein
MIIDIQVKSLLFSFFYGIVFSILLHIIYKHLYKGPLIFRILISFLTVVDSILIYFITLKKINEGVIHNYFIFMILLGFVIMETLFKKVKYTFHLKK